MTTLNRKVLIIALIAIIVVSSATCAWIAYEGASAQRDTETDSDVVRFKIDVNGVTSEDIVPFDISDGVTSEEAKLIAEMTFVQVMGRNVVRHLDTLGFNDTHIEAHYAWGYGEGDLRHVFDMIADLVTLHITVNHCF